MKNEAENIENQQGNGVLPCVSHWHSWHERPIEGSDVEVMWSDNTVDDLRYEKSAFETINFKAEIIPIKWCYACG